MPPFVLPNFVMYVDYVRRVLPIAAAATAVSLTMGCSRGGDAPAAATVPSLEVKSNPSKLGKPEAMTQAKPKMSPGTAVMAAPSSVVRSPAKPVAVEPLPQGVFQQPDLLYALQSLDFGPFYRDRVATHAYLAHLLNKFNSADVLHKIAEPHRTNLRNLQDAGLKGALSRYVITNPDFYGESSQKAFRPYIDAVMSMAASRKNGEGVLEESFKAMAAMAATTLPIDILIDNGEADGLALAKSVMSSPDAVRQVLEGIRLYLSGGLVGLAPNTALANQAVHAYLESIPERVVADVELLARRDELYWFSQDAGDLAMLAQAVVRANSANPNAPLARDYVARLVKAYESLEDGNPVTHVSALASLCYLGGQRQLLPRLNAIITDSEEAEERLTVLAAAGLHDEAMQALPSLEHQMPCDRARLYLAVIDAENGRFAHAQEQGQLALEAWQRNAWSKHEAGRAFCLLCEVLARRGQVPMATRLSALHPSPYYQAVSQLYTARGARDLQLLGKAVKACRQLPEGANGAVLEAGLVATTMSEHALAQQCVSLLNPRAQRQFPIVLLSAIIRETRSATDLLVARAKFNAIPESATGARADAIVALALTECVLSKGHPEQMLSMGRINALEPQYRVRFHLRLLGLRSLRFHGDTGTW